MPYGETKVYNDGSHYIAIPHTTRPKRKKSKRIKNENGIGKVQIVTALIRIIFIPGIQRIPALPQHRFHLGKGLALSTVGGHGQGSQNAQRGN